MIASAVATDVMTLPEALALGPSVWDGLLSAAPIATPFAGWAWHHAVVDASGPEDAARSSVVVLREGGVVQALLPFRLARTRFRHAPVTALEWAVGDVGCPDHLDLPALPGASVDALLGAIDGLSWDVMLLDNVAEQAPQAGRLSEACARRGWTVRRTAQWQCPYLRLPPSWDAYLATLTPTRRQTVRRKERNLHRHHAVALTDYGPGRWAEGWRRLKELHARRWDGAGAFADARIERLHQAFGDALAERGAVWLTTLDLDGAPAAAWYGFATGDTVCFYQGGWDPRWETESVGAVLMGMMIRRAIERGYRTFDFLRGEEPYKMTWTATARSCYRITVIRPGWRGAALRLLDGLAQRRGHVAHA